MYQRKTQREVCSLGYLKGVSNMKFGMQFTRDELNLILKGLSSLSEAEMLHGRISALIKNADYRKATDDGIYKTFPIDKLK
jgi:hypothetical protein